MPELYCTTYYPWRSPRVCICTYTSRKHTLILRCRYFIVGRHVQFFLPSRQRKICAYYALCGACKVIPVLIHDDQIERARIYLQLQETFFFMRTLSHALLCHSKRGGSLPFVDASRLRFFFPTYLPYLQYVPYRSTHPPQTRDTKNLSSHVSFLLEQKLRGHLDDLLLVPEVLVHGDPRQQVRRHEQQLHRLPVHLPPVPAPASHLL